MARARPPACCRVPDLRLRIEPQRRRPRARCTLQAPARRCGAGLAGMSRRCATARRRRAALQRMGSAGAAAGRARLAFGASIVAVRVWPAADYTRVTIESDRRWRRSHFLADNPPRLVVDIDGLELSPALRELVGKVRADDPFIAGVRVGQNQPRVVRLVIDLKQPVAPQLFTLAPVAAYQHRLVFDLYPTAGARPAAGADPRQGARRAAGRAQRCRTRWASSSASVDKPPAARGAARGRRRRTPTAGAAQTPAPTAPPTAAEQQPHRPPDHRRARPRPWRRGPRRHRPERPAREGRGAGDRAAAARPPQRACPACARC